MLCCGLEIDLELNLHSALTTRSKLSMLLPTGQIPMRGVEFLKYSCNYISLFNFFNLQLLAWQEMKPQRKLCVNCRLSSGCCLLIFIVFHMLSFNDVIIKDH